MAATRLIALHINKGKTVAQCLADRTDYSENAAKTEDGKYISAYACDAKICDEEFLLSKRQYEHITGRTQAHDVIAYQIRQSFKPGEITPEEANKVGYETAMRFTKGTHAFIVATHVDRAHIHNHSEVAECDFTDVYMRSIGHASQVEKNLYPVEAEMKQQLTNAQKYKDVIREEKDLTKLVGTESNFDVDSALRTMLTYYECWQGHAPRLIDRISIADEEITQHLKTELVQDRTAPLMSIQIDNFPNEEGYFMLWELSISEKESGKRILPIFVNCAMVLRPMAGKRIMDVFLDGSSKLRVSSAPNVDAEIYSKLEKSCMDFAYDTFVELKEKQMQQNEESFKKYMYALELRQEAAEHIGIENIRRSRLQKLQKEKANIEAQHRKGSQVYPDFRLIMMARLEA